jgi:hypothetical protein
MTAPMRTALTAIAHQLDADFLPTLAMPLPRELETLLAQLVAYDNRKRKSIGRRADEQLQLGSSPGGAPIR